MSEVEIKNEMAPDHPEGQIKQASFTGIGVSQIYYNFINSKNGKIIFQTKYPKVANEFYNFIKDKIIETRTDIIELNKGLELIIIRDYMIKVW